MQLQIDMVRKFGVTPEAAASMRNDDLYDQFHAGRYAIIRGASARIPRAIEVLGADKVGFMPTPSFAEGSHSPTEAAGFGMAVWSKSANKELAGKFVEFMSSREADTMWVTRAGTVPMRKSTIATNHGFFSDPKNAHLAHAAASMNEVGWFPPDGVALNYNEELNRAAQDVLTNGTPAKLALERAEAAFNRTARVAERRR